MDIGHLTDFLPQAFTLASNFAFTFPQQAIEATNDIWAAIHEHDAMAEADRKFQLAKVAGASIGLCLSIAEGSITGIAGFAIADSEAMLELEKAGHKWRTGHVGPNPSSRSFAGAGTAPYQGPM